MKQGTGRRIAALLGALVVLFAGMRPALADNVDKVIRDLGADDYKVRLSATSSLAKLGDERAIEPLIEVLQTDSEKTVRGAAAVALGKIVNSSTDSELAEEAKQALTTASKKDKQSFVKKQAKKALAKVKKAMAASSDDGGGGGGGGGGIYVNISEMSAKIDDDAETLRALMRKTVDKTFGKEAPDMATTWPGSDEPSKKALKGTSAFYVDGTITSVTTKDDPGGIKVSCKVSMLIASYPEKSMFGFLEGKAAVIASDTASEIKLAKKDCISAVVEDLTIKKIIPTIKAKAGN
jgi:hypothetical protein